MKKMSNEIKKKLIKTFNSRIDIKRINTAIIEGRKKELEEAYFKCWCNPRELYGKELYEAINIKLNNVLIFEVRYCEKIREMWKLMQKDKKDFFIIFEEQRFNIFQVDFKNNSKEIVLIKANGIS